jgi:glycosyltransferase involved in cell wall biosynthesis
MASGLPVIATRVGGIPDLVQDGVNGILVPPADAEALCRAVASLASSAQMRTQLGVSARASAEQHSWARICEQFGRLILNH